MAGMSNYLRNKVIDWFHRGVAFTPPDPVYIALCSSAPTASTPGTELAGAGYARQSIAKSTTAMSATNGDTLTTNPSTGTTGVSSNNAIVNFGTAGASWGVAAYWESYDAVTAGNRLHYGPIIDGNAVLAPRTITIGDPVSFPISALRFFWA